MLNITSIRDRVDALPSTPEVSAAPCRREALFALAAMFGLGARTLMGAPVPAERKERTGRVILPSVPEEQESPEVLAWVEKHLPGISKEKMRKLLAHLDDDDFETREAASEELAKQGTASAPAVWPLPYLRASPGDKRSPEVQHRIGKFLAKQNHPTRIPPIKGTAQEIIAILAQHGRANILTHPGAEKQIATLLMEQVMEVPKDRNSFFEILEAATSGAGVAWKIVEGNIVLSRGPGKLDAREMLVDGPLALIRNREQSKEKDAPVAYTLVMEPQRGRVVALNDTATIGGDFGPSVITAEPSGEPAWKKSYGVQPALRTVHRRESPGKHCTLGVSMATSVSDRIVPIDGTPVDLGCQRLTVIQKDGRILLSQHIWADWPWCQSPLAADMMGWLMTTGNQVVLLNADGKPIPASRRTHSIQERIVTAEYLAPETVAVWVRGPATVTTQDVAFRKK